MISWSTVWIEAITCSTSASKASWRVLFIRRDRASACPKSSVLMYSMLKSYPMRRSAHRFSLAAVRSLRPLVFDVFNRATKGRWSVWRIKWRPQTNLWRQSKLNSLYRTTDLQLTTLSTTYQQSIASAFIRCRCKPNKYVFKQYFSTILFINIDDILIIAQSSEDQQRMMDIYTFGYSC